MTQEAGTPRDLWGRIQKMIDDSVAKLARSGMLRNSSISEGGSFTIKGGEFRALYPESMGSGIAVYVGDQFSSGDYVGTGLLVQGPSGVDMIVARQDEFFGRTRIDIYDSGNRIIFGNDASSGQGMARPWLDYTPGRTRYIDWPTYTLATTDAWETVLSYSIVKQLPRLEVCLYASMDTAATTGELRVLVDGVQLGSTAALSFSQGPKVFGPANVAGQHMETLDVEVQIRRTTATGGVKLEPAYCRGRQSP